MTVIAPPRSPYKGLAAFEDTDLDALFFFGRERERAVIVANLVASRLTLLFGESGVGKSSLLRAGVVRELREQEPDAAVLVHDVWSGPLDGVLDETASYIVLDQFEEFFLYHEPADFRVLAEVLEQPHVHVLISLREDALAQLDAFKARIPFIFGNQIRLEHLDLEAASAAILGPVERWNELAGEAVAVEPALVAAVLEEVGDGERVEAPYLQLVLEKLWPTMRVEALRRLGGAEAIVRTHLEDALASLTPAEQGVAAAMFEHLITPSGSKIAHRAGDLAEYARVPDEVVRRVLDTLTRDRIVRSVEGSDRYEIFHDVLVGPILEWRLQRRLEVERRVAARRIRRLAAVAIAAAVLLAVVAAIALFALAQRSHARSEARHAHAGELAANALASIGRDPVRSLTLALAAVRLERNSHVADVLRTSLLAAHLDLIVPTHDAATAEALSPSGRRLAVGDTHGNVSLYDVRRARRVAHFHLPGPVSSLSFDLHGRRLLAVGHGRALLVEGARGRELAQRGVRDASFGNRGRQLVTGSGHVVRIWSSSGKPVATIPVPGRVSRVALAPDGKRAAAAWRGTDTVRHVALIDVARRQVVSDLLGSSVAFSPARGYLATGDPDTIARVYRAATGQRVAKLGHGGSVTDVDFSPDGKRLATASADGAGRVWDIATGIRTLLLPSGSTTVHTARFSRDGRFVVTAGGDGVVRLWNAVNGRELLALTGHRDAAVAATPSASGNLVASASNDGTARVWTTDVADQLRLVARTNGPVVDVDFAAGRPFAAASGGVYRGARLLHRGRALVAGDAFGGHVVAVSAGGRGFVDATRLRVPTPGVAAVFSADGRRLLVAGGREAKLLDVASGKTARVVHVHAPVSAAAFAPDGGFALGSVTGGVDLFTATAAHRFRIGMDTARVVAVAFSPDGARVAYAARNGLGYEYSARNARLQHVLRPAHTPLADIAFSPDGRYIATSATGGDVRLYAALDGRLIHVLRRHDGLVARIAFSPDGDWLVSAGPASAAVWHVADGQFLLYLYGHQAQLRDVAFSADGRRIVTGSDDGTVRQYVCTVCGSVYELAKLAHARIVRISTLLTTRERRRYLGG